MSTVFLIRHGESQTNVGLPTILHEGAKLTIRGIEQAKQIAAYLKSHTSLDLIVTSRYQRTKDTAAFTQSLFSDVPLIQWEVQEFTYLASLHHELLTIEQRKPLVDTYWEEAKPFFADGPGSESFEAFMKRAYMLIEELKSTKHDTIAIFSHEQFITALLWILECRPMTLNSDTMRDYRKYLLHNPISNGSIVRLQVRGKQLSPHFKRITEHLEQPLDAIRQMKWEEEKEIALPVGC